ncbi:hypothetical protein L1987_46261 [Smallanthus sonchifolius]|uniref:Uncharacterized protein n=1 Tax=Smallanthus sonchifolius TaxID=185202 RepID=A0ACB9G074_9ASTR|nr:hypothetical protein L1987_46261 [Smallanthus sonchifolius]
MSDYLPSEIHAEIMKRLPVKSLIQFRSVSKTWESLIDSSDFIGDYSRQHTQPQHLLVKYDDDPDDFEEKYVSYIDDDTFPEQKVSQTVHLSVKYHNIMGHSHGVLCLYDGHDEDNGRVVLWNWISCFYSL